MTKPSVNFGLVTGVLEITVCGLLFAVNPNYFFNPVNGMLQSFTPLTQDAILRSSDEQLDDLTYYSMTSFGVGCIGIGIGHLWARNDPLLQKELLECRFWLAAVLAYVSVRAAFVDDDLVGLHKVVVGFFGGMSTVNFLWTVSEIMNQMSQDKHPVDNIPRTPATALQFMTLWLDCMFCALWATTLLWNPRSLEPGNPMAIFKATPMEDNTFMDVLLYTTGLESAPLMAFTLCMLKLVISDRSVEAIRANNKLALTCFALYTTHFLREFVRCEYADQMALAMNMLINVGFSAFLFKCGPNIFEAQPTPKGIQKKDEVKLETPDLVVEPKKKAI